MAADPGGALAHLAWKLRLFWLDVELGNNLDVRFFAKHYDPVSRALPVGFGLLVGLGLLGLVASARRAAALLPLSAFPLVYGASVVAFFVCARYRVPLLPPLAIFSAYALVWLGARARTRSWRAVAGGLLLVGASLVASFWTPQGIRSGTANGYLSLGLAAEQEGEGAEAVRYYELALDHDQENAYAWVGLARAVAATGNLERAERILLERLDHLDAVRARSGIRVPSRPEAIDALVGVLCQARRFEDALALVDRALREGLPEEPLRYARGRALAGMGELGAAAVEFEWVVRRRPSTCPAWDALVEIYEFLERPRELERARAGREEWGCVPSASD